MPYKHSLLDYRSSSRKRRRSLPGDVSTSLDQPFRLNASVGYGPRANRRSDVALIETALDKTRNAPAPSAKK